MDGAVKNGAWKSIRMLGAPHYFAEPSWKGCYQQPRSTLIANQSLAQRDIDPLADSFATATHHRWNKAGPNAVLLSGGLPPKSWNDGLNSNFQEIPIITLHCEAAIILFTIRIIIVSS